MAQGTPSHACPQATHIYTCPTCQRHAEFVNALIREETARQCAAVVQEFDSRIIA